METNFILFDTYFNEVDAELVSSLLKSSGIEVIIRRDDLGGIYPQLTFTKGINLLVKEEDQEDARKILSDW